MKSIHSLVNGSLLCLIALSLALAGGCLSTPSSGAAELRLTMTSAGMILFEGKAYAPGVLPAALKSHGVALDMPILVAIPDGEPMDAVKDLGRRLASTGYRRFVFVRPKHADAARVPMPATR